MGIFEFSRYFGGMSVLYYSGGSGILCRVVFDLGIFVVIMEIGGFYVLDKKVVDDGLKGV